MSGKMGAKLSYCSQNSPGAPVVHTQLDSLASQWGGVEGEMPEERNAINCSEIPVLSDDPINYS